MEKRKIRLPAVRAYVLAVNIMRRLNVSLQRIMPSQLKECLQCTNRILSAYQQTNLMLIIHRLSTLYAFLQLYNSSRVWHAGSQSHGGSLNLVLYVVKFLQHYLLTCLTLSVLWTGTYETTNCRAPIGYSSKELTFYTRQDGRRLEM